MSVESQNLLNRDWSPWTFDVLVTVVTSRPVDGSFWWLWGDKYFRGRLIFAWIVFVFFQWSSPNIGFAHEYGDGMTRDSAAVIVLNCVKCHFAIPVGDCNISIGLACGLNDIASLGETAVEFVRIYLNIL